MRIRYSVIDRQAAPVRDAQLAFGKNLAQRIRDGLIGKTNIAEKKMFGGVGFLLNGNMLVGVWKDSLIVRLGPDEGEEALLEPHVREFTGRP
jgi:TfoX/Sxy family transcriptional regulator of competence genes